MKRLSILFVGLLSFLLAGSVVGLADVESSTTGTLTLGSVINIAASGNVGLTLTQDMMSSPTREVFDDETDTEIDVSLTTLTNYKLYSAYDTSVSGLQATTNDLLYLVESSSVEWALPRVAIDIDNSVTPDPTSSERVAGAVQIAGTGASPSSTQFDGTPDPTGPTGQFDLELDVGTLLDNIGTQDRATDETIAFEIGFFVEEV